MPKGVLLVGPPGTGKTLLAQAVAGEAGVPFFSISGSEFVEMFVGVGAARVRDLFEQARQKAPAIIFIDELDALGRARGIGPLCGGHDEKEQTLNQLLVEMDGFDPSSGLVLLAATNRPEILDPALLRAGRFDRQVLVDRPDKKGRVQILKVHLRKAKLAPDVDPEQIAALTPGFTGADLANLVNEAALLATRRSGRCGDDERLQRRGRAHRCRPGKAQPRCSTRRSARSSPITRWGMRWSRSRCPASDPVHKVSIIPRGIGALGYTIQRPTEDRFLMTREELENKMVGAARRTRRRTGRLRPSLDRRGRRFAAVTDIARSMVTRYGMSTALGPIAYEQERGSMLGSMQSSFGYPEQRNYGEVTATTIDEEVRSIVQAAFERTVALLKERREILEVAARRLLEKETLNEHELLELVGTKSPVAAALSHEADALVGASHREQPN